MTNALISHAAPDSAPGDNADAPRRREIFVTAIGAYDNLGDAILRRVLLNWLRELGTLHVFVGHSPDAYDDALGVGGSDRVYKSYASFYRSMLSSAARGHAHYAFKAGEIQLTLAGMKEHVSILPAALLIRARGGKVIRVGTGARNWRRVPSALLRPSVCLSNFTAWREADTARYLGRGEVMPDLAFATGRAVSELRDDFTGRDVLAVSMRADGSTPTREWIDAIRQFAANQGLEVVTVSQVREDSQRAGELAIALGGRCLNWETTINHSEHETALRELYRRAAVAVSDRLHVLITALSEGAIPVGLVSNKSGKIQRHFDAAGFPTVAFDTSGMSVPEITSVLFDAIEQPERTYNSLEGARLQLKEVRETIVRVVAGGLA